ncbi:uncharacterized protein LOC111371392 isoform X7 [Olea europaea var. sylvestris]|uniref:uncharacterized protein LOC111371392 isoform X7 n=1 Tax=Olea europaea var. sylvestris TaxID=158386 RepID=UPI000C1D40BD|nr:uncharacterized protein LOC111371392 isoform X7 [Olea europaea var. sylvestris]
MNICYTGFQFHAKIFTSCIIFCVCSVGSAYEVSAKKLVYIFLRLHQKLAISKMSNVEGTKISIQDIKLVENRIKRCLQHYMNKEEVLNTLIQDNVDPRFTDIVWQRLEEQNSEFFNAYYLQLMVKEQIMEFNRLLSEQVELMYRTGSVGMAAIPTSNGSHVSPTEDVQQPNAFNNCGSSIQSRVQETLDVSAHDRKMTILPNLFLGQHSNVELAQATNGKVVKTKAGYAALSQVHSPCMTCFWVEMLHHLDLWGKFLKVSFGPQTWQLISAIVLNYWRVTVGFPYYQPVQMTV